MTHTELINRLSNELDLTKTESHRLVKEMAIEFAAELGKNSGFTIPRLGTFKVATKAGRKMYSPHYKTYIDIPPKKAVEFSPASVLKEHLKFLRPENE
ncbi:MAG: HU family DNA-binding protein [Balneolaceae bacterium]